MVPVRIGVDRIFDWGGEQNLFGDQFRMEGLATHSLHSGDQNKNTIWTDLHGMKSWICTEKKVKTKKNLQPAGYAYAVQLVAWYAANVLMFLKQFNFCRSYETKHLLKLAISSALSFFML